MRAPETKIKEAIIHPEGLARPESLNYFADCFSRDAEVMPMAIKAIETFGRRNAFMYTHPLVSLAQTEASVEWAIRELHREDDKAEDQHFFYPSLSRLLCKADAKLVAPRLKDPSPLSAHPDAWASVRASP